MIHNSSFVRNQAKVFELFLDDKGDANHCPVEDIAMIIVFDPLNNIFSNLFDTPFQSQEYLYLVLYDIEISSIFIKVVFFSIKFTNSLQNSFKILFSQSEFRFCGFDDPRL